MQRKPQPGRMVLFVSAGMAIATILFGLAGPPGLAQSQTGVAAPQAQETVPQSFEVASIKPSAPDTRGMMKMGTSPGGRYTASGITVKILIQQAYDLKDFQISGGPSWLTSERYDIVAKADMPNINRDQLKVLLQSLLAERFNLKVHRETKELPIYTLVVGKNGHKLHESEVKPDDAPSAAPPPDAGSRTVIAVAAGGGGAPVGGDPVKILGGGGAAGVSASLPKGAAVMRMGGGRLSATMAPISTLVTMLSQQLGRPVLDKTGLTGKYDFTLEYTPDETQRSMGMGTGEKPATESPLPSDPSGPSIFTALQDQLGLKLEAQKGPVEILVVDHIERASGN